MDRNDETERFFGAYLTKFITLHNNYTIYTCHVNESKDNANRNRDSKDVHNGVLNEQHYYVINGQHPIMSYIITEVVSINKDDHYAKLVAV